MEKGRMLQWHKKMDSPHGQAGGSPQRQHWGMWRSLGLREGKEPSPGGGWQGKPRVRPPNYRLARWGHGPGTPGWGGGLGILPLPPVIC